MMCQDTRVVSDSREVARRSAATVEVSGVDPADEPSAAWGWHGGFPTGTVVGGVLTIIACVAFFFGPYQTSTQDWFLGAVIVIIIGGIIGHTIRRRHAWRR